ncbi:MAG: NAD/NADP transhydrogenase alpha subunit [Ilumatobacter sp.]|jgi:NAD/NADP transhydrogenase alpha subunit
MSKTDPESQAAVPIDPSTDPVRIKRAKIAKWTSLANRVGYLFVVLAMALFFMAFAFGFTSVMATLVIISLVIGCVLLAPSIILGYAVKAADRDDRERGL